MRLPDMNFDPRDYRAAFLERAAKKWKPVFREKARNQESPRPRSSIGGGAVSSARMGGAIGRKQARAVDSGIDLRRGQRGMAEQVLDGSQVASPSQKMRGEGMAQRMRRRGFRQAEGA